MIERSLVTCSPPMLSTSVWYGAPSMCTSTSVVPPPRSISSTPSSRSSPVSTAFEEARGSSTISFTLKPARFTHFTMFCAEVTAPVMMWASASRRTPTMPTGLRMPPCWSTMNSWGMTCSTSRSMGMTIAFAASITRSTSSLVISRSRPVTATTPRELMPSMCPPAMPVVTPCTSRPDISSALSMAFWMDLTVLSMLMTTPRRRPREGVVPTPMISRDPVSL